MRAPWMVCGSPLMRTVLPRLKRLDGKSVTMRHLISPRIPCAASTCATTRKAGLDDVEVDSGAFARGGGFDEGAEAADDSALTADDFADVLFVDFELVDRGVAILDLVDLDRFRLVDQHLGDVLDQPFQIRLELFELLVVIELFFVRGCWGRLGLLGHSVLRRRLRDAAGGQQAGHTLGRLCAAAQPFTDTLFFDDKGRRFGKRVVVAQNFKECPVSGRGRLGDDHTVGRLLLSASTAQPDLQQLRWCLQRALLVARMGMSINQRLVRTHVPYFREYGGGVGCASDGADAALL